MERTDGLINVDSNVDSNEDSNVDSISIASRRLIIRKIELDAAIEDAKLPK